MQSTEEDQNNDHLIAAGQEFRGDDGIYAELITELADALAAERDRADRAEARLAGLQNEAHRKVWISGALWALRDQGFEANVYLRDAVSSKCPFPDDTGAAA